MNHKFLPCDWCIRKNKRKRWFKFIHDPQKDYECVTMYAIIFCCLEIVLLFENKGN